MIATLCACTHSAPVGAHPLTGCVLLYLHQHHCTPDNLPHGNKRQVTCWQHFNGWYTTTSQKWAALSSRLAGWPCHALIKFWAYWTEHAIANLGAGMRFPPLLGSFKIMPIYDDFGPWKYHAQETMWYFGCFVCLHNQEKSEKLLVLQRSRQHFQQGRRTANLKGETTTPKRNKNFHNVIALIPSALHLSFIHTVHLENIH